MLPEISDAWEKAWKVKQVKRCKVERYHVASDVALELFEKMSLNDRKDDLPIYLHPAFEKEGPDIAAYFILQAHIKFNQQIQKEKKPCASRNRKPR